MCLQLPQQIYSVINKNLYWSQNSNIYDTIYTYGNNAMLKKKVQLNQ